MSVSLCHRRDTEKQLNFDIFRAVAIFPHPAFPLYCFNIHDYNGPLSRPSQPIKIHHTWNYLLYFNSALFEQLAALCGSKVDVFVMWVYECVCLWMSCAKLSTANYTPPACQTTISTFSFIPELICSGMYWLCNDHTRKLLSSLWYMCYYFIRMCQSLVCPWQTQHINVQFAT